MSPTPEKSPTDHQPVLVWEVQYTDRGSPASLVVMSREEPLREQAAMLMRDRVLRQPLTLVDARPGELEPTLLLLRTNGIEILRICRSKDLS